MNEPQTIEIRAVNDKDGVLIGIQIGLKECKGYMDGKLIYLQQSPITMDLEQTKQFIDGLSKVIKQNERKE